MSTAPVAPLTVIGASWCPDCRRAKTFLGEQRVPYEWIDLEQHPEYTERVEALNGGSRIIPTIIFPDGSHLAEPGNDELADKLGLTRVASERTYDLVIVGGGPTGLTAAIYAARENFSVLIVEKSAVGGQAGVTERLDNYPGFPDGVAGHELADRMRRQAERYGVEILQAVAVTSLETVDESWVAVATSTGDHYRAHGVLLATGSLYRRTGAAGEADLIGAGIHFCATCDGPFYRGADEVVVIGGGNSGFEEGIFLTQFARHVTIVEYADAVRASRLLQDKVAAHPSMSVHVGTAVVAFEAGAGKLTGVVLEDRATGQRRTHRASGAFVFIGLEPNTAFLVGEVDLDDQGFVVSDEQFRTSMPGVYVAGDVRRGSTKQLASAVGEGAAAAIALRYHLDRVRA